MSALNLLVDINVKDETVEGGERPILYGTRVYSVSRCPAKGGGWRDDLVSVLAYVPYRFRDQVAANEGRWSKAGSVLRTTAQVAKNPRVLPFMESGAFQVAARDMEAAA